MRYASSRLKLVDHNHYWSVISNVGRVSIFKMMFYTNPIQTGVFSSKRDDDVTHFLINFAGYKKSISNRQSLVVKSNNVECVQLTDFQWAILVHSGKLKSRIFYVTYLCLFWTLKPVVLYMLSLQSCSKWILIIVDHYPYCINYR